MKPLHAITINQKQAFDFIAKHHRHHSPPTGWKFGYALAHNERVVGVAVIGRPVSRVLARRGYLEVTRTCTIVWGVNRELYRWASQFAPICTYTTDGESGESLRHAGWIPVAHRAGRPSDWNSPARRRIAAPAGRTRWEPAPSAPV